MVFNNENLNALKGGYCVDIKRPFEATQSYLIGTLKYQ